MASDAELLDSQFNKEKSEINPSRYFTRCSSNKNSKQVARHKGTSVEDNGVAIKKGVNSVNSKKDGTDPSYTNNMTEADVGYKVVVNLSHNFSDSDYSDEEVEDEDITDEFVSDIEFKPIETRDHPVSNKRKKSNLSKRKKNCNRNTSEDRTKYKCNDCSLSFETPVAKKKHKAAEHQYPCTFRGCVKVFTDKSYRKNHIRVIHNGEKNHQCNICAVAFGKSSALQNHIYTIHTDVKDKTEFICDICEKVFYQKVKLELHRSIHSGEKPHQCEIQDCGKLFRYCIIYLLTKFFWVVYRYNWNPVRLSISLKILFKKGY